METTGQSVLAYLADLNRNEEFAACRAAVPEEFEASFQAIRIAGGFFGCSDLTHVAVCRICGAMIYPTAIDRHSRFHEEG